jgi:hypothetical protein
MLLEGWERIWGLRWHGSAVWERKAGSSVAVVAWGWKAWAVDWNPGLATAAGAV